MNPTTGLFSNFVKVSDFSCLYAGHFPLSTDFDSLLTRVENHIGRERFLHSVGTYHTMLLLAQMYGKDPFAAGLIGLLHDIAHDFSSAKITRMLERYGAPLSGEDLKFPQIWHARLGAVMLEAVFGIHSPELASAIRVHSTGAPGMTPLARFLFVADYVEPTRHFDGVERFRKMVFSDPDTAFLCILEDKINHVRSKQLPLHPDSVRALKFYTKGG